MIKSTTDRPRIWNTYPELVKAIRDSHETYRLRGHHDIYHAMRVGDTAHRIALDEWGDEHTARLAGIAGLCHNADRILGMDGSPSDEAIGDLVRFWLSLSEVDLESPGLIIDAVLAHDQKNGQNDSSVLIALQDADRVVNLNLDVIMRTAQLHHNLPTVDYAYFTNSPTATFKLPKSVARVFEYVLEWVDTNKSSVCIRTQAGLEMARPRARLIRGYLDSLKEQLQEEGIFPAPF